MKVDTFSHHFFGWIVSCTDGICTRNGVTIDRLAVFSTERARTGRAPVELISATSAAAMHHVNFESNSMTVHQLIWASSNDVTSVIRWLSTHRSRDGASARM